MYAKTGLALVVFTFSNPEKTKTLNSITFIFNVYRNSEPATWEQQVLAPPDDLIATPELEFELAGLQPDTLYKIKIAMVMRDLANSPASSILTVKTLPRRKF